jgi:hypothetical protein
MTKVQGALEVPCTFNGTVYAGEENSPLTKKNLTGFENLQGLPSTNVGQAVSLTAFT